MDRTSDVLTVEIVFPVLKNQQQKDTAHLMLTVTAKTVDARLTVVMTLQKSICLCRVWHVAPLTKAS